MKFIKDTIRFLRVLALRGVASARRRELCAAENRPVLILAPHPNDTKFDYDALKRYVLSTGYVGIFDTDFILNRGELYFIECNFRNGAYGYCTTAAGFNMPEYWATGGEYGLKHALKDIVFMDERTNLLNVLNGNIPLLRWLKDVLRTDTFLFWNRRDPAPYFRIPAGIKQKFAAMTRKLKLR